MATDDGDALAITGRAARPRPAESLGAWYSRSDRTDRTLAWLLGGAAAFYGAMWGVLLVLGIRPVLPSLLLLSLFIVVLPAAFLAGAVVHVADRLSAARPAWRALVPVLMVAVTLGWNLVTFLKGDARAGLALLALLAAGAVVRHSIRRSLVAGATLLVFFAGIWQANYAVLWLSRTRLLDPFGRASDVFLYRLFGLDVSHYVAVFPFVSGVTFTLLEHAYMFLLPELMAVLFLVSHDADDARALPRVVAAVAACYVSGVVVYLVLPLSGPCLYYPASISPSIADTLTGRAMAQSLVEYDSVRASGAAVTGFAYFIALPSLHAALATLMQLVAWRRRWRGWMLLPVNAGAILATFLLGWHYAVDTVAGIVLGICVYQLVVRPVDTRLA